MGLTILFFPEELSTQMGLGSQAERLFRKTRMHETEGIGSKSLSFLSDETESWLSEMRASMEARTRHSMMPCSKQSSHGYLPPRQTLGTRPREGSPGGHP